MALPLEDINREAAREKSIRHGHPSTLHLWWARRSLTACRAVLFASLVHDPSECVAELLADAAKRRAAEKALAAQRKLWEARKTLLNKAQAAKISAPEPGPELKLEEIIVETERLFDIIRELVEWENSNDDRTLNKALIEIPPQFAGKPPVNSESRKKWSASGSWKGVAGLAEDIRYHGQWMRNEPSMKLPNAIAAFVLDSKYRLGRANYLASWSNRTRP